MEKLILSCGRYIPLSAGDAESRVRAMEAYLARMSEELEVLLGEMGATPDRMETAQTYLTSVSANREGGN